MKMREQRAGAFDGAEGGAHAGTSVAAAAAAAAGAGGIDRDDPILAWASLHQAAGLRDE